MPQEYETHPDDVAGLTCPTWATWLDARQVAVKCAGPECGVVYTRRYWFTMSGKGKWVGGIPKTCKCCADRKKEAARKLLPINPALVAAVKAHAEANYSRDGWDVIVESYTDAELWEVIAGAKDEAKAIKMAKSIASLHADRRSDVAATAW